MKPTPAAASADAAAPGDSAWRSFDNLVPADKRSKVPMTGMA